MMAIERQNLSQLYPGFAPAKPNHRTSVPLSCASFELKFAKFGEGNKGNIYTLINLIADKKFVMVGRGANRKSMGYIGNIVKFLVQTIDFPKGVHIFNYADKPDMTVKELVEFIRGEFGLNSRPMMRLPYSIGLIGGYTFDILSSITGKKYPISSIRIRKFCANTTVSTKALEEMGFKPSYTLREGLKRIVLS